ncbi:chaperone NapD [Ruegeria arenilitoris]|uniref:chaperone NapD n=1 Tax=Ruegeria arenilitoris TaxID=1173585 RepID=UPI00147F4B14|nr:chaperone NapD [Ruegeria arenilitoris]
MNICGCLVHVSPDSLKAARDRIESVEGAEVHAATEDGRLVVVVEDTPNRLASETIMDLHHVPGVISLSLTYHHFEDPADTHPQNIASHQI